MFRLLLALAATVLVLLTGTVIAVPDERIPHSEETQISLRYYDKSAPDQAPRYRKDRRLCIL